MLRLPATFLLALVAVTAAIPIQWWTDYPMTGDKTLPGYSCTGLDDANGGNVLNPALKPALAIDCLNLNRNLRNHATGFWTMAGFTDNKYFLRLATTGSCMVTAALDPDQDAVLLTDGRSISSLDVLNVLSEALARDPRAMYLAYAGVLRSCHEGYQNGMITPLQNNDSRGGVVSYDFQIHISAA